MFKKLITHTILKKIYYTALTIFGSLFLYHIVRFYIVKADCDYILGTLNQALETTLAITALIAGILSITQIISGIIIKKRIEIILNFLSLIIIAGLLLLFIYNTLLECFLYDLNLDGLFL